MPKDLHQIAYLLKMGFQSRNFKLIQLTFYLRLHVYCPCSIKLNKLPRDTKINFTVLFGKPYKKHPKKLDAYGTLCWVNCLLYDYKNELKMGKSPLKMWPGNPKPTGTCVAVYNININFLNHFTESIRS